MCLRRENRFRYISIDFRYLNIWTSELQNDDMIHNGPQMDRNGVPIHVERDFYLLEVYLYLIIG